MKKALLSLLLVFAVSATFAQNFRNADTRNSKPRDNRFYGGMSLVNPIHSAFISLGSSGGSIGGMLGYEAFLNNNLSVDVSGYLGIAASLQIPGGPPPGFTGVWFYDAALVHFNFISAVHYSWYQQGKTRLYSGLGIGYSKAAISVTDDYQQVNYTAPTSFAFQIDGIGVERNLGKHFGFWTELGYGNQGILQMGLSVLW